MYVMGIAVRCLVSMVDMSRSKPFLDSTPLLGDAAALQARASESGHLFFRGLLPGGDVRKVADAVLDEAWSSGWFESAKPTMGEVIPANIEPIIEGPSAPWRRFYCSVYRRRELHALNQHPRLLSALATLFADEVLAHPRVIARVMFPNAQRPGLSATFGSVTCSAFTATPFIRAARISLPTAFGSLATFATNARLSPCTRRRCCRTWGGLAGPKCMKGGLREIRCGIIGSLQ